MALPAHDPAPTLEALPSLDRTALLARFNRKSTCRLCSDEPYVSGSHGFRCPAHRSEWNPWDERYGTDADSEYPIDPYHGAVPGHWVVADSEREAYYRAEGRPPHYQDDLLDRWAQERERVRSNPIP